MLGIKLSDFKGLSKSSHYEQKTVFTNEETETHKRRNDLQEFHSSNERGQGQNSI